MDFFDFVKRALFSRFGQSRSEMSKPAVKYDDMSRAEQLMYISHERVEAPRESCGGMNFIQLVDQQLAEGKIDLAYTNLGQHIYYYFRLANLYWGQADLETARSYLAKTLERYAKLQSLANQHSFDFVPLDVHPDVKAAAYLLGVNVNFIKTNAQDAGQAGFIGVILDYCLGTSDFDPASWQRLKDHWIEGRQPKYQLAEFDVYAKALTGQYSAADEMLGAHETMFKARARRNNTNSDFLEGYSDNECVIDYVFACVLKRIGWEGRYRHSWPLTDGYTSTPETYREPDYLKIADDPTQKIEEDTKIFSDPQKARQYIDQCLEKQLDFDGEPFSAKRGPKLRDKVSVALKDIGWVDDPQSLELMQDYRMDRILNDAPHIFLCDPVKDEVLKHWTEDLSHEFGLHPDFIAVAASEERSDYMDPTGYWYVYWKHDKQIYAVDRDEWHDPVMATKDAALGLTLWPSYTSFVAWWASEHLRENKSSET